MFGYVLTSGNISNTNYLIIIPINEKNKLTVLVSR